MRGVAFCVGSMRGVEMHWALLTPPHKRRRYKLQHLKAKADESFRKGSFRDAWQGCGVWRVRALVRRTRRRRRRCPQRAHQRRLCRHTFNSSPPQKKGTPRRWRWSRRTTMPRSTARCSTTAAPPISRAAAVRFVVLCVCSFEGCRRNAYKNHNPTTKHISRRGAARRRRGGGVE